MTVSFPIQRSCRRLPGQHGQVLLLYALMSVALIGMLGLALDLGFNFAQRRSLQNAADGAVFVALSNIENNTTSTSTEVSRSLTANLFPIGGATTSSWTCIFVGNNNDNPTAPAGDTTCASPIPLSTSGAKITLNETYPTFIMGVLGFNASSISATATGHLEIANALDAANVPFIVCGNNTAINGAAGNQLSIYTEAVDPITNLPYEVWPPTIDSSFFGTGVNKGTEFLIYAPAGGSSGKGIQRCGLPASDFKGPNNTPGIIDIPCAINPTNCQNGAPWGLGQIGKKTGPTLVRVANGCKGGSELNCVVVIPVAEDFGAAPLKVNGVYGPSAHDYKCTPTTPPDNKHSLCLDMWVAMTINPTGSSGKDTKGVILDPQPNIQADGSLNFTVGGNNTGLLIAPHLTN